MTSISKLFISSSCKMVLDSVEDMKGVCTHVLHACTSFWVGKGTDVKQRMRKLLSHIVPNIFYQF